MRSYFINAVLARSEKGKMKKYHVRSIVRARNAMVAVAKFANDQTDINGLDVIDIKRID